MQTANRSTNSKVSQFLIFLIFILTTVGFAEVPTIAGGVKASLKQSYVYSYTSQPGSAAGLDTFLSKNSPTANNGTSTAIIVGENASGTPGRENTGLIKFDLSPIPPTAILTNATITLTISSMSNNVNHLQVSVRRLTRDWQESTATWNIWSTSNNWGLPGALDSTDSNLSSMNAFTILNTMSAGSTITFTLDGIAGMVDGTYSNYGWGLYNTGGDDDQVWFYSSDDATPANRPVLFIEYELPACE